MHGHQCLFQNVLLSLAPGTTDCTYSNNSRYTAVGVCHTISSQSLFYQSSVHCTAAAAAAAVIHTGAQVDTAVITEQAR